MYIADNIQLVKNNKNYVKALIGKNVRNPFNGCSQDELKIIYEKLYNMTAKERFSLLYDIINEVKKDSDSTPKKKEPSAVDFKKLMSKFIDFFIDFNFSPSIRFMNTLAQTYNPEYISNYFAIMNSPYLEDVQSKIKSPEFKELLSDMKAIPVTKKINNRFDLYYGSQGTGKTTTALRESDGRCIICNGSMVPSDLMEDFVFSDGKASFQWSEFARAMMNGYTITLDEINLLPFETLRFLQGLVDNKKSFVYKGKEVTIKEGFKIIGTMNLIVNGAVYNLPEPLVDRCSIIKEFTLSPEFLLNAF